MAIGRFRKQQMHLKYYYVDILNNNIIQYVLRKKSLQFVKTLSRF